MKTKVLTLIFFLLFSTKLLCSERVMVPLVYKKIPLGEITVDINENEKIEKVFLKNSIHSFKKVLDQNTIAKINLITKETGNTLKELSLSGVVFSFNKNELTVELSIPLHRQKKNDHFLKDLNKRPKGIQTEKLSNFNGFLNIRPTTHLFYGERKIGNNYTQADFKSSLRYKDFVLISNGNFNSVREHKWNREDLTLIKDFQNIRSRLSIGDISYQTSSNMGHRPLGGVMFESDFSIDPYQINTPINENEFILKKTSTVKFYSNESLVKISTLPPGRYNIKDLPNTNGLNSIKVIIEDLEGNKESLIFRYSSDQKLLKRGIHQFSYATGLPYQTKRGSRSYNPNNDELTNSFFHRYGFSSNLTGGLSFQRDNKQNISGMEFILASFLGNFGFNYSNSKTNKRKKGSIFNLSYSYKENSQNINTIDSFDLNYTFKERYFAPLGNLSPNNISSHLFTAVAKKSIKKILSISFGYKESFSRDSFSNSREFSSGLYKHFSKGPSISLNLSRKQNTSGNWSSAVTFFMNYNFTDKKHSIYSYHDSSSEISRIAGRGGYQSKDSITNINGDITENAKIDSMNFGFENKRRRIYLRATQDSNSLKGKVAHKTSLGLSTAFVFSGNSYAISNPITGSYALVSPNKLMKGKKVPINCYGNYICPQIDKWGNAVVNGLTPYSYSKIEIDSSYLPEDINLKNSIYNIYPTLNSSSHINIGPQSSIYITGKILDLNNKPLSYKYVHLIDSKNRTTEFFTDKKGNFFIEEVKDGKFQVKVFGKKVSTAHFEIPKGFQGRFHINKLRVKQ